MATKTTAQRKADERQRRRDAGLVPMLVYVAPGDRVQVRELVAKLQRRNTKREQP